MIKYKQTIQIIVKLKERNERRIEKYMKELSDNSEDTVKIKNAESKPNDMTTDVMPANGIQTNGKEDELNIESYNIDSQPSFSTFN